MLPENSRFPLSTAGIGVGAAVPMHPRRPGSPPRAARLRLPVRLDIGGLVPRGQGRRRRPPRLQVPAHTRQRKRGNYDRRAPPLGRLGNTFAENPLRFQLFPFKFNVLFNVSCISYTLGPGLHG